MKKNYSIYVIVILVIIGCSEKQLIKKIEPSKIEESNQIDSLSYSDFEFFKLPTNDEIDSIMVNFKKFNSFSKTILNLSRLDVNGLEVFLMDAIVKSDELLLSKFPSVIDLPQVKSRLKVVKTKILICKFHSSNNEINKLTISMEEMFSSYNDFLEIIYEIIINEKNINLNS
jgi:hypothetical protein